MLYEVITELAFAIRYAFRIRDLTARVELVTGADGLLPGHGPAVVRTARQLLAQRGIGLHQGPAAGERNNFV